MILLTLINSLIAPGENPENNWWKWKKWTTPHVRGRVPSFPSYTSHLGKCYPSGEGWTHSVQVFADDIWWMSPCLQGSHLQQNHAEISLDEKWWKDKIASGKQIEKGPR